MIFDNKLIVELKKMFPYLDVDKFNNNSLKYKPVIYFNNSYDNNSLFGEIARNIKKKPSSGTKKSIISENTIPPNNQELYQIFNKYNLNNNEKNFIISEIAIQNNKNNIPDYKFKFIDHFPKNCQVCNDNIVISFDGNSNFKIECENKSHKNQLVYISD